MALSLAFLAPEIVKAAVEARLPRGFGQKRLVDLPMAWPDQWRTLGLRCQPRRNERFTLASGGPSISSIRTGSKVSNELARESRLSAEDRAANSNLGNGILRPETFDPTLRQ
jgi:hypothetical protein